VGVVHQNLSHRAAGSAEELDAAGPVSLHLSKKARIDLMNQSAGLKGVIWSLTAQVVAGNPPHPPYTHSISRSEAC